ncbi:hypothetical protein SLE2022_007690 [Rubroshorea leprosula]
MAQNPNPHLGLALIALFFLAPIIDSVSVSDSDPNPPTVYEILPKFGLPGGLLPNSVTDYTLQSDGRFTVELEKPCYVQFEYLVYYDKTIKGKLSYGSITELEGIQVQRFFFWLGVDEIKVDLPPSNSIYFQVGFINKKLDLEQFKTVHSCRDGLKGPCRGSWKWVLELPTPTEDIPMLITE